MFPKRMILRSKSGSFALCALSGALAAALTAGPALAAGADGGDGEDSTLPMRMGRVVAKQGLVVRTGPSTHYRVIGSKRYGSVVEIACRVNGQRVKGNPVWYKLGDHSYAWSSERDIVHDGDEPRWC
ncbi:SH3 domain-containing protein [Streptomyces sp. NPDC050355]|uniref:SH3 domain-containing protein n=1 Tax=Streptomyces sirii TaxID=3127701 RepID=A0ABZ2QWM4_9ACTN